MVCLMTTTGQEPVKLVALGWTEERRRGGVGGGVVLSSCWGVAVSAVVAGLQFRTAGHSAFVPPVHAPFFGLGGFFLASTVRVVVAARATDRHSDSSQDKTSLQTRHNSPGAQYGARWQDPLDFSCPNNKKIDRLFFFRFLGFLGGRGSLLARTQHVCMFCLFRPPRVAFQACMSCKQACKQPCKQA